MRASVFAWALGTATVWAELPAQIKLGERTTVVFATAMEGGAMLATRDEFVQRMSPFDRAARMKTGRDVSADEYLGLVAKNVLVWSDAEVQRIVAAIQGIQAKLNSLALPFPK